MVHQLTDEELLRQIVYKQQEPMIENRYVRVNNCRNNFKPLVECHC